MNSNKLWMTAPSTITASPSCFGMPMIGHAFGTTTVVRERVADLAGAKGAAKADRALAQSYFGNSAWRPPTC